MTNGDRADRLLADAEAIATEMEHALLRGGWNLAARRAQEVVELAVKALLNEIGIEYPKTHDPAPVLAQAMRSRGIPVDEAFLEWLLGLSAHLGDIRGPAFYQEIEVGEGPAREDVAGAARALQFARDLLARLRR